LQVHHSAPSFDPSRRFRPWLFTIAVNKARDHLRSRGRRREVSLSMAASSSTDDSVSYLDFIFDDHSAPSDTLEEDERRVAVQEIVSTMPDHLREVLVLGYYHRFPYRRIAEVLGIPLGTVKSRLHAAVAHFATCYRQALDEEGDPK